MAPDAPAVSREVQGEKPQAPHGRLDEPSEEVQAHHVHGEVCNSEVREAGGDEPPPLALVDEVAVDRQVVLAAVDGVGDAR